MHELLNRVLHEVLRDSSQVAVIVIVVMKHKRRAGRQEGATESLLRPRPPHFDPDPPHRKLPPACPPQAHCRPSLSRPGALRSHCRALHASALAGPVVGSVSPPWLTRVRSSAPGLLETSQTRSSAESQHSVSRSDHVLVRWPRKRNWRKWGRDTHRNLFWQKGGAQGFVSRSLDSGVGFDIDCVWP